MNARGSLYLESHACFIPEGVPPKHIARRRESNYRDHAKSIASEKHDSRLSTGKRGPALPSRLEPIPFPFAHSWSGQPIMINIYNDIIVHCELEMYEMRLLTRVAPHFLSMPSLQSIRRHITSLVVPV